MAALLIVMATGLGLLLYVELAGYAALRIGAIVLLVLGGIGVGASIGLRPSSPKDLGTLRAAARWVGYLIAAVMVAPVVAGLVGALIGAPAGLQRGASGADGLFAVVGGVLALLFLAGTIAALIVSLGAIRTGLRHRSTDEA